MLGLAWSLLQGTLTTQASATYDRNVKVSLAVILPTFAAFYVWTGKIIYHATAFYFILVVLIVRGHYLFYFRQPRFPETKCKGWRFRARKAVAILVLGYVLWNIDLEFCAELRSLRERVGLPWAWLLELHGWWHILTAIGASQFMDVVREMQQELGLQKRK